MSKITARRETRQLCGVAWTAVTWEIWHLQCQIRKRDPHVLHPRIRLVSWPKRFCHSAALSGCFAILILHMSWIKSPYCSICLKFIVFQSTYFFLSPYFYYWYSALGPVWAETRVQSGDWYDSGTLHPGQVLRGSLPLLSPFYLLPLCKDLHGEEIYMIWSTAFVSVLTNSQHLIIIIIMIIIIIIIMIIINRLLAETRFFL